MLVGKMRAQLMKKTSYTPPDDKSKVFPSLEIAVIGATYKASCTVEQQAALSEGTAYDFELKVIPKDGKNKIELVAAFPIAK